MNDEIAKLAELVFDISTFIPDQKYLELMKTLSNINSIQNNNKITTPNEYELLYYKMVANHNRLKRNYRRINKNRKEQMESMETTIEALQNEIEYLSQNKPRIITGNDFISV